MSKTINIVLGSALTRFFYEFLVEQQGVSRHTVLSYRDTWRLFLRFSSKTLDKPVANLSIDDMDSELVLSFLNHLEKARGVSIPTRNVRLAAIHSFFRFLSEQDPERLERCIRVLQVPFKRSPVRPVDYLEDEEVAALLKKPNPQTVLGRRDRTLLALLYNTGARIQEVLDLRISSLQLGSPAFVKLKGKGGKSRVCPLFPETTALLQTHIAERQPPPTQEDHLFLNRRGEALTAAGVRYRLRRYVASAITGRPRLAAKRVTPHTFRHTAAVHLLASGVDLNVVRGWLGHVNLDTTNHYAQIDMATKRRALEAAAANGAPRIRPIRWKPTADILSWLDQL